MKFRCKGVQVTKGMSGYQLLMPAPKTNDINNIKNDVEYEIEIKRSGRKRSLDANALCWAICQELAEALSKDGQYISKEDVYREDIQDSQPFQAIPVRDDAVDTWKRNWEAGHTGQTCIVVGPCRRTPGYTLTQCYYGSSTYNTQEMSRLIDCLLDECKQLGIATKAPEYIEQLINEWSHET